MISLDVSGIHLASPDDSPVLILKETDGTRSLPIWISSIDAAAIAVVLDGDPPPPRPMTHDLLATTITHLGEAGQGVITGLNDGVYSAQLHVGDVEIDARPSDVVAVCLRLGWQIACSPELLDQVGVEVAEVEADEVERFREFLDTISPDDFEG